MEDGNMVDKIIFILVATIVTLLGLYLGLMAIGIENIAKPAAMIFASVS